MPSIAHVTPHKPLTHATKLEQLTPKEREQALASEGWFSIISLRRSDAVVTARTITFSLFHMKCVVEKFAVSGAIPSVYRGSVFNDSDELDHWWRRPGTEGSYR